MHDTHWVIVLTTNLITVAGESSAKVKSIQPLRWCLHDHPETTYCDFSDHNSSFFTVALLFLRICTVHDYRTSTHDSDLRQCFYLLPLSEWDDSQCPHFKIVHIALVDLLSSGFLVGVLMLLSQLSLVEVVEVWWSSSAQADWRRVLAREMTDRISGLVTAVSSADGNVCSAMCRSTESSRRVHEQGASPNVSRWLLAVFLWCCYNVFAISIKFPWWTRMWQWSLDAEGSSYRAGVHSVVCHQLPCHRHCAEHLSHQEEFDLRYRQQRRPFMRHT